jgi:hypothetical protein
MQIIQRKQNTESVKLFVKYKKQTQHKKQPSEGENNQRKATE